VVPACSPSYKGGEARGWFEPRSLGNIERPNLKKRSLRVPLTPSTIQEGTSYEPGSWPSPHIKSASISFLNLPASSCEKFLLFISHLVYGILF
jgi:hypothetical protein